MSTFRLGSSCSPAKFISVSVHCGEEEDGVEDAADPNRLVQCPYDKSHQIRACRMPFHLIKCQKNHPKLARTLKTCPFNAHHLMPEHELAQHIASCADRRSANTADLGRGEVLSSWHVPVNTWEKPKCGEDWEKEIEESPAAPFIWRVSNSGPNPKSLKPKTRATNGTPPGMHAPTKLPLNNCSWKTQ